MSADSFNAGSVVAQSTVRRPRGVVRVNGKAASFCSAEVTNKSHFTADTWRVELEPWNQPEGFGLTYWADAADVMVEILVGSLQASDDVGAAPSNLTSLIVGQVDDVEINTLTGKLEISGRDLSARMIDTKTTNKWPDHVSSWIATTIAKQANLTPQVTTTSTPVGEFYDRGYVSVTRDIPEWDLLVFLAQQEGFDCYVTGTTLYFGPPQADDDPNPLLIRLEKASTGIICNAGTLRLRRSLTLAKDISVTVLSHGIKAGKTVKAQATRAGSTSTGSSSASSSADKKQSYVIRRPNLTQEQAQALANSMLADITKFELTFDADLVGDAAVSVHRMAQISGTQTSFDQKYYLQQVTHRVAFEGGHKMSLIGKNHSTASEPVI